MIFGFTIKRYRGDIIMDNPYNRNNYKKRTTKQKQILKLLLHKIYPRNKLQNLS